MIEYDFIMSGLKDLRRRLEVLINHSDDDVEVAHLYRAKHETYEAETAVKHARECYDHPKIKVEFEHVPIIYAVGGMDDEEADRLNGFGDDE